MTEVKDRIREIRNYLKLSQETLAIETNSKRSTVSGYEAGISLPHAEFLAELHIKYGVNSNWILTGQGEMFTENNSYNDMAETSLVRNAEITLFIFKKGKPTPMETDESDPNAMILLPMYGQPVSAGPGQPPNQLKEIENYIPVLFDVLGGTHPKNCGLVRVVGDSMTDVALFSGDVVIFDQSQTDGDGIYVIGIDGDLKVKRVERRSFEKKVIISSENAKRYPTPEVLTYEEATQSLHIYGKVIGWLHKHPY